MITLTHDTAFTPCHGEAVPVAEGIRRLTAANAGPFTFHGTNSYLIGEREIAVLDPGPDDDHHLEAILAACQGRPITTILISHTHRDHCALAARLKARTGASILGCGPHRTARPARAGDERLPRSGVDEAFRCDQVLEDGETFIAGDMPLTALATPGHTMNHLAFAVNARDLLFSADHVMAWSTTAIAPPDGAMGPYMASLDKLLARPEQVYLPAHGGVIQDAQSYVEALKSHRQGREGAVLAALAAGPCPIPQLVERIYTGLAAALVPAAGLSLLAHLEDLEERGLVQRLTATPRQTAQAAGDGTSENTSRAPDGELFALTR